MKNTARENLFNSLLEKREQAHKAQIAAKQEIDAKQKQIEEEARDENTREQTKNEDTRERIKEDSSKGEEVLPSERSERMFDFDAVMNKFKAMSPKSRESVPIDIVIYNKKGKHLGEITAREEFIKDVVQKKAIVEQDNGLLIVNKKLLQQVTEEESVKKQSPRIEKFSPRASNPNFMSKYRGTRQEQSAPGLA